MADTVDRVELLDELDLINVQLSKWRVPAAVPTEVASLYDTAELPGLIAAARRQLLTVLYQMGGTA